MPDTHVMARAAVPLVKIIGDITPDQLDAPTPCTEYSVRGLVNHLLFWGPCLEGAARKQTVPPPAGAESDVDLTDGDWVAALEARLDRLVEAWSRPAAWYGVTRLGGPTELPAATVGGMALVELAVHGWDLARATGQRLVVDDDVVEYLYDELGRNAEQGRQIGVYAPAVALPAGSSTWHRVLALTGRDPAWTSQPAAPA